MTTVLVVCTCALVCKVTQDLGAGCFQWNLPNYKRLIKEHNINALSNVAHAYSYTCFSVVSLSHNQLRCAIITKIIIVDTFDL